MDYKVGDKVRIRKEYQKLSLSSEMIKIVSQLAGQIVTIKDNYGSLYSVEENDYFWTNDMLEPVNDTPEEVLNKLEDEIKENIDKNCKAGEMVNSGQLDPAQDDLLIAQMEGYQTINKIIRARINLIKSQLTNKEGQENKSNDEKEAITPFEKRYCYHLIDGDDYSFIKFYPSSYRWLLSNTDAFNGAYEVSFTDKEIKDSPFDLNKFEKVSV